MKIIISDPGNGEEIDPIEESQPKQITDNELSWEIGDFKPPIIQDKHSANPPNIFL